MYYSYQLILLKWSPLKYWIVFGVLKILSPTQNVILYFTETRKVLSKFYYSFDFGDNAKHQI